MSGENLHISKEKFERKIEEISCGYEGAEKKVNCPDVDFVEGRKM